MRTLPVVFLLLALATPAWAQAPGQLPGTLPPAPTFTPPPPPSIPAQVPPSVSARPIAPLSSPSLYRTPVDRDLDVARHSTGQIGRKRRFKRKRHRHPHVQPC